MNRVVVIEFITLDGVVEDPDGSDGKPFGGWAFRYGPEAVAGDKFKMGDRLRTGTLVLGSGTWKKFSKIWPGRTDEFSMTMNAARKLVVSRTLTDVSAWDKSRLLDGELTSEVQRLSRDGDVIVIGSTSIVHTLMDHDLVDEIRLLVFPAVLGTGSRLFISPAGVSDLRLASAEQSGAAALLRYEKNAAPLS